LPVPSEQAPAAGVPTATPITTFGLTVPSGLVSTADVNVTATVPPGVFTLKMTDAAWRTPPTGAGTVPGRVSDTSVGDVAVDDVSELPLHPTQMTVTNKARARDRFRCFMETPENWGGSNPCAFHNSG